MHCHIFLCKIGVSCAVLKEETIATFTLSSLYVLFSHTELLTS